MSLSGQCVCEGGCGGRGLHERLPRYLILFYFISLYFILFLPLTSGNESRSLLQTLLNSGHLWNHLPLPSHNLPCRRLMAKERGCRKCHRDAHMVSSKSVKMRFLSTSGACYAALNTLVVFHRAGMPKQPCLFVLHSPYSIYTLSLRKCPPAIFKTLTFIV